MIAEVSFPIALNRTFYYRIPERLTGLMKPGLRIVASFAGRERVAGYVTAVLEEKDADLSALPSLKEITEAVDSEPVFPPEKLGEIVSYMASRWYCEAPVVLGNFLALIPDGPVLPAPERVSGAVFENPEFSEKIKKFLDAEDKTAALVFNDRKESENLTAAAAYALSKGLRCLFLVPDIPSAIALYKSFLNGALAEETALWHSRLTKKRKRELWNHVYAGEKRIVAGTKSSVFLPFLAKTLIIMADHGNEMYRQFDQKPYYNTRALAMKLAGIFGHKILLAGNPPDAELYHLHLNGGLELLDEGGTGKIRYEMVDMRKNPETAVSPELNEAVKRAMAAGRKAYVIASSRGFSPRSFCAKCYWMKRCGKCNSLMHIFEDEEGARFYRCSYCSHKEEYSASCGKCGNQLMVAKGFGVQRIFKELKKMYPEKRILKFDGDDVKKSVNETEKIITGIMDGNFDVLLGTAIILDSFLVREAGTVAFAEMYHKNSADFRLNEKILQNIMKASALLGYGDSELVIQSHEPESFSFLDFADYRKFLEEELDLRKTFSYPPFSFMARVEFISADPVSLKDFSNSFIESLRDEARLSELNIIEHRYPYKLKFVKRLSKYSHSNTFKIGKDAYGPFLAFIAGLKPPKKTKISVLTDL